MKSLCLKVLTTFILVVQTTQAQSSQPATVLAEARNLGPANINAVIDDISSKTLARIHQAMDSKNYTLARQLSRDATLKIRQVARIEIKSIRFIKSSEARLSWPQSKSFQSLTPQQKSYYGSLVKRELDGQFVNALNLAKRLTLLYVKASLLQMQELKKLGERDTEFFRSQIFSIHSVPLYIASNQSKPRDVRLTFDSDVIEDIAQFEFNRELLDFATDPQGLAYTEKTFEEELQKRRELIRAEYEATYAPKSTVAPGQAPPKNASLAPTDLRASADSEELVDGNIVEVIRPRLEGFLISTLTLPEAVGLHGHARINRERSINILDPRATGDNGWGTSVWTNFRMRSRDLICRQLGYARESFGPEYEMTQETVLVKERVAAMVNMVDDDDRANILNTLRGHGFASLSKQMLSTLRRGDFIGLLTVSGEHASANTSAEVIQTLYCEVK